MQKAGACFPLGPEPGGGAEMPRTGLVLWWGHHASSLPADSHPDASCTELPRAGHSERPRGSSVQDPSGRTEVRAGRRSPQHCSGLLESLRCGVFTALPHCKSPHTPAPQPRGPHAPARMHQASTGLLACGEDAIRPSGLFTSPFPRKQRSDLSPEAPRRTGALGCSGLSKGSRLKRQCCSKSLTAGALPGDLR